VLKRLSQVLMLVAVLAASGAQWTVLQSIAWTTMLANNLQTRTFCQALTMTFDGKHPCCLCKAIAAGKRSQKKQAFSHSLKRLEFLAPGTLQLFPTRSTFARLAHRCLLWHAVPQKPPLPPPRCG
jgi:hypothetical protein